LSTVKVSLHDVVDEGSAVSSIVFNGGNAFMDSKMNDMTSYWNIGIGDVETFASSENSTRNIGIGKSALNKLKTGTRNVGIGTYALSRLVSGDRNVGIGSDAFWFVERGEENVAVGYNALGPMNLSLEANRNVAIGSKAGSGMTVKAEDAGLHCVKSFNDIIKDYGIGSIYFTRQEYYKNEPEIVEALKKAQLDALNLIKTDLYGVSEKLSPIFGLDAKYIADALTSCPPTTEYSGYNKLAKLLYDIGLVENEPTKFEDLFNYEDIK